MVFNYVSNTKSIDRGKLVVQAFYLLLGDVWVGVARLGRKLQEETAHLLQERYQR
jgi:hypothetical protein